MLLTLLNLRMLKPMQFDNALGRNSPAISRIKIQLGWVEVLLLPIIFNHENSSCKISVFPL